MRTRSPIWLYWFGRRVRHIPLHLRNLLHTKEENGLTDAQFVTISYKEVFLTYCSILQMVLLMRVYTQQVFGSQMYPHLYMISLMTATFF